MSTYGENTGAYDDLKGDKPRSSGGGGGGRPRSDPGDRGPHPHRGGGDNDTRPPREGSTIGDRDGEGDRVTAGGSYTTGGGYSSGGYSSSSGGSSSAGASGLNERDARLVANGESLYFQLWGEYPPTGYVKALVKRGLNIFEIEDHERRKPAFRRTDTYQDEYSAYAKVVANIMGTR